MFVISLFALLLHVSVTSINMATIVVNCTVSSTKRAGKVDVDPHPKILGTFFTMKQISINVCPNAPETFLHTHLLHDNGTKPLTAVYSLDRRIYQIFIDPKDGTLRIYPGYKGGENFSFHVEATAAQEGLSRMEVTVNALPAGEPCIVQLKDICFWNNVEYQIFENRKETLLGKIGPSTTYKQHSLTYSLLNGSQFMEVRGDTLWSKGGLDREATPEIFVEVSCHYNHTLTKQVFKVTLLDDDDNPPYVHSPVVELYVNNHQIEKGNIEVFDRDASSTGTYSVTILGDELNILKIKTTNLSAQLSGISGTTLHCRITMLDSTRLSISPYNVTLRINNTSLLPGNGKSHVDLSVKMSLALPKALSQSVNSVTYEEPTVTMMRNSTYFARVTQPKEAFTLSSDGGTRFFMKDPYEIFNVTYKSGIVYVQNTTRLILAPNKMSVTVTWEKKGSAPKSHTLTILLGPPQDCKPSKEKWHMCSEYKNDKGCNSACGLGVGRIKKSGNGRCEMRGVWAGRSLTTDYLTCTVDAETCPDGWCDPLEELNFAICPQDCIRDVQGPANINPSTGRGIISSTGVCTCDRTQKCTCISKEKEKKTTTEPNPVLTDRNKYSSLPSSESTQPLSLPGPPITPPKCDGLCKAGVVGGSLMLSALLGLMLLLCRKGKLGKSWRRREIKLTERAPSIQGPFPGLQSSDTLLLAFNETTPIPSDTNLLMLDPKFEFPRSQLIIEQCLGEGEFGKVLRATARDIAGVPGLTTVAVKTVKANSTPSELADLLSEYQMLKEVSHPNVIKLLGASTIPGGPVYLIIEFAEEGSLRNYLRRSRHISLSENSHHNKNIVSPTTAVEPITPRDILSFSWQIAKGMAYLTEMKLVHRDLAARNVLVAAGKVCKVSDFGLTRDVYVDDAYLKRSKGRVPVKWMALESLADHVYTTKTDVWSFGVLLWELVTLGASPYPGVAVHNLFHLLRAGYRMEKPENCSHQLYSIMRSCWMEEPIERPSFKHLTSTLEKMLEDGTEYLNLELKSRIAINRTYFTDLPPQDDFEKLKALLDYKVPPSRHNVNSEDKLPMNGKVFFPEENDENNTYMNNIRVIHYENEHISAEDNEEKYESPIRVINTTLSTEPPSTYVSMEARQVD